MGNACLEIHIDSAATIPDIEELLAIDLSKAEFRETPPGEVVPGKVGWIRVYYKGRIPCYGEYDRGWKYRLILSNAHRWNDVRLALGLGLCQWLLADFPGYYLGRLDTGSVLFYGNQEEMTVDDGIRAWCEASKAFGSYPFEGHRTFGRLQPV